MTVVTGVSGSGKSTLVGKILYPALARQYDQTADTPGSYSSIGGDLSRLQAVEFIDQGPIGKSSRSNPATYLKAFDEIRQLFAQQQLSKQMGYMVIANRYAQKMNTEYKNSIDTLISKVLDRI